MRTDMFASIELSQKIERAEARMIRDIGQAAAKARGFTRDVGGGVAAFIRPGSPINKIIGVALESPFDPDRFGRELEAAEQAFSAQGEPVRIELSTLAPPEAGQWLTTRGYRLCGFENVLGRALAAVPPAPASSAITIQETDAATLADWKTVVTRGFSHSDESGVEVDSFTQDVLNQVFDDMVAVPGYQRYLAYRGTELAGGASLRLDAGIAQLAGASTAPEHRRQGVQSALLDHRLRVARAAGAEIAVITTAGGTRSQANAIRNGFSLLYSRAVLVLEP